MQRIHILFFTTGLFCLAWGSVTAGEGHGIDDHETSAEKATISHSIAGLSGLTMATAGPLMLNQTLTSYGHLVTDPEQRAHVTGRFPGLVRHVMVRLGDTVTAGEPLARIESNESLQTYTVTAPINGHITQRTINVGEQVDGQPLFAITNLSTLWAELKIFPGQRQQVSAGQSVQLKVNEIEYSSTIQHLLPSPNGEPYTLARLSVDNSAGLLVPGQLVTAEIVVSAAQVPLAVDRRGLQEFQNAPVVFVQNGEDYEARTLQLGRIDEQIAEVISGLVSGERYVVENSYLVKAELEKSTTSHAH